MCQKLVERPWLASGRGGIVRPVGAGQPPNRRGASQYERKAAAGAMKKLLELREIRKVALLLRVSTEDQVGGNSLTT